MIQLPTSRSQNVYAIILCCYTNYTSNIQVTRISNTEGWYFERVVFPGQRLLFEAPDCAQLEIYTGTMASAMLADRIAAKSLQVMNIDP